VIQRHGWTLLFHQCLVDQIRRLETAVERAKAADPRVAAANTNVKLFNALSCLILDKVPSDPSRDEYRLGTTMGDAFKHWRRAKIGRRFRLFFRFDSKARIIVFAWVNDNDSLRAAGSKRTPYAVFRAMLNRGDPPDDWAELVAASTTQWPDDDSPDAMARDMVRP
jgi:toxin YhaV